LRRYSALSPIVFQVNFSVTKFCPPEEYQTTHTFCLPRLFANLRGERRDRHTTALKFLLSRINGGVPARDHTAAIVRLKEE